MLRGSDEPRSDRDVGSLQVPQLPTATWPPDASRTAAGAACAERVTHVKPARAQHHREATPRLPDQRLNPFIEAIAEMLVARALKDPRVAAMRGRLDADHQVGYASPR